MDGSRQQTPKIKEFINAIVQKKSVSPGSCSGLYGRFMFTDIDENGGPVMELKLEERLGKAPDFVFILGPDGLEKFPGNTLNKLMVEVLGWGTSESLVAAEKGQRLGVLVVFDSTPCHNIAQLATVDGIITLMKTHVDYSSGVLERFLKHADIFRSMAGEEHFQKRINTFSSHWESWAADWDRNWRNYEPPNAPPPTPLMTPERYAAIDLEKVTLADSRRHLNDMFWCSNYFGFDGYTYNTATGTRADLEYLVPNLPLHDLQAITIVLPVI